MTAEINMAKVRECLPKRDKLVGAQALARRAVQALEDLRRRLHEPDLDVHSRDDELEDLLERVRAVLTDDDVDEIFEAMVRGSGDR